MLYTHGPLARGITNSVHCAVFVVAVLPRLSAIGPVHSCVPAMTRDPSLKESIALYQPGSAQSLNDVSFSGLPSALKLATKLVSSDPRKSIPAIDVALLAVEAKMSKLPSLAT